MSTPVALPADRSPRVPSSGSRGWRARAIAAAILCAIAMCVVWATDVDVSLTTADERAIAALGVDAECETVDSYDAQVTCIRAIQRALVTMVPDYTCVDVYGVTSHEPAAFLERRRGCCYDRSRLVEKAATLYGLDARHVAIYRTDSALGLLRGGIPSHSLSEIHTVRGWIVVDSNSQALGLRRDGSPLDVVDLGASLRAGGGDLPEQDYAQFFDGEYRTIYGLYSRHGGFYPPYVPLPDLDWRQVHYNLAP